MFKKTLWILLVLLSIFALKNPSFFNSIINSKKNTSNNKSLLALTSQAKGKSWISSIPYSKTKIIKNNQSIFNFDKIETGLKGQLTISFTNGNNIKLLSGTTALIKQSGRLHNSRGKVTLKILRGDYKIISTSDSNLLIIESYKNEFYPKLTTPILKTSTSLSPTQKHPKKQLTTAPQNSNEIEKIQSTIYKQKYWFNRCYSTHLKKIPTNNGGSVNISFEILPSGQIQQITILKSTINDNAFKACLRKALTRVKFKSFTGEIKKIIAPVFFGEKEE